MSSTVIDILIDTVIDTVNDIMNGMAQIEIVRTIGTMRMTPTIRTLGTHRGYATIDLGFDFWPIEWLLYCNPQNMSTEVKRINNPVFSLHFYCACDV